MMMVFFKYLVEVSICITALYIVYHFFLQQEKLFGLNRGYLLMALITAFAIPLLEVTVPQNAPTYFNLLEQDFITYYIAGETTPNSAIHWTWQQLLIGMYSIGVLVLFLRFLSSGIKLYFLVQQGEKQHKSDYHLILIEEELPVFSFLNYVFLYKNHGYSEKEKAVILAHETAHIRERHTLDILLIEGCKILLWFNPIMYLYQKRLKEVHEYLADAAVVESACTTIQYATLMMQEARKHTAHVLPMTHFFHNQIENRLIMLSNTKKPNRGFKIFLSLPVVLMLFLTFSVNGELFSQDEILTESAISTEQKNELTETKVTNVPQLKPVLKEEENQTQVNSEPELQLQLIEPVIDKKTVQTEDREKPINQSFPPNAVPGSCYSLIDEATNNWAEVVCPSGMTKILLEQVNKALKSEGYTIDPQLLPQANRSGLFKLSKTTITALNKYQTDNKIPVGPLTIKAVHLLVVAR